MVNTIKCDHCGAETKHAVVKVIDGKALNFCCAGCLQVYEFLLEERLAEQAQVEERQAKDSAQNKH
jgi:hypothetical protein